MKSSVIFLDWHNTLSSDQFWAGLRADPQWQTATGTMDRLLFGPDRTIVDQWMRGRLSSEQVVEMLSHATGIDAGFLFRSLVESCEQMRILGDVHTCVSALRKSAYVVVSTDNMDCFSRFTVPALALTKTFDDVLNSADSGYFKKDADGIFFRAFLDRVQIPFSRVYLFDDSRETCELFESWGGRATSVTNLSDTVTQLRALRVTDSFV